MEQAQARIWKRSANAMLPQITKLIATLEAQLQQREIRSIPPSIVKPMEDQFDMLKDKERLYKQVNMDDFTNVSDMVDNATFMTKAKDKRNALTLLTQLVCAVRKQQRGA